MNNRLIFCYAKPLLFLAGIFSSLALFAQKDSLLNTITVAYDHTHFSEQFANDWQVSSLEYKRQTGFGALLGRVNYANRFAKSGIQFEGEAYPVLSRKLYAFTGISYSADVPIFPAWRTGSTLYWNFAKRWEGEGGFRYLYFDKSIWMGTAGLSKYLGAWLLNARSFFSVDAPLDNRSFFLKAQRFLSNEKDYVWVQVGSGVSPDEARSFQLNTTAQLVTERLNAGAKLSLSKGLQLTLGAGYARDEYSSKTSGRQYSGCAGLSCRF